MTIKDYMFQIISIIITIIISILIVVYIVSKMVTDLKSTIVSNPYPYTYDKPTSVNSNTIYDGSSLNEFTKVLDNLADRLD